MDNEPRLTQTGSATEIWRQRQTGSFSAEYQWTQALYARLEDVDRPRDLVPVAHELAEWAPAPVQRGLELLLILVLSDLREGSTKTLIDQTLEERLTAIMPVHPEGASVVQQALHLAHTPEQAAPATSTHVEKPAPLIIANGALQLSRMAQLERRLGEQFLRLMEISREPPPEAGLKTLDNTPYPLTDEQLKAVKSATYNGLSVITGGPGTGKTSIILALIRRLQALGLRMENIALSAPTGKAARRLAESVKPLGADGDKLRIQTLHRLLGAAPGRSRFLYNADHPLPAEVVIVDEASMLDLDLSARLVEALAPRARLVLLGDAEQIPSVDPGAVLLDLTRSLPTHVVHHLRKSFRMNPEKPAGRQVWLAAQAILQGDAQSFLSIARRPPLASGAKPVQFIPIADRAERDRFLQDYLQGHALGQASYRETVYRPYTMTDGHFSPEDEAIIADVFSQAQTSQMLTITRHPHFQTGSEAINKRIHSLYAQLSLQSEHLAYLPGEPVLMLQNDHKRRIYNGDVGLVLYVSTEPSVTQLMAVFPGTHRWMAFELETLQDHITLAHAMTVHKAQGSEYERISLLLPDIDVPLLTREILYTAVTRARTEVRVAGIRSMLTVGLKRQFARKSGLRDAIVSCRP